MTDSVQTALDEFREGRNLLEAGNYKQAIRLFKLSIKGKNLVADSYYNIGKANSFLGRYKKALASYAKALELNPDSAEIHTSAGKTLSDMGKYNRAVYQLKTALWLRPDLAESYRNLANVQMRRGAVAKAAPLFSRALVIEPEHADTQCNLGSALMRLGKVERAIRCFWRSIDLDPEHKEAHSNLGWALKSVGDLEGALFHCERAVKLYPGNPNANNNLGTVLQEIGRIDEAVISYIKAVRGNWANAEFHSNLGSAFQALGKLKEARISYRIALRKSPDKTHIRRYLADITKHKKYTNDVKLMERMAAKPDPNVNRSKHLFYALAKTHEDLGNYEKSFSYLLKGNSLHRSTIKFDNSNHNEFVDRIIRSFPRGSVDIGGTLGGDTIFILGMPRSGTTLIEQILASHQEVCPAGEINNFNRHISGALKSLSRESKEYPEGFLSLPEKALQRLGYNYLNSLREKMGAASYITNKMPGNFHYIGLILAVLPGARIIHSTRNPVDTCLSCFQKLFTGSQDFTYDLTELGVYYCSYQRLMRHWREVFPGRILDVRYEDVVADQEGQSRRMLDYCGLDWDPACLSFYKTKRSVSTASAAQVRKPIYTNSVERWKRFEPQLAPLIKALGLKDN